MEINLSNYFSSEVDGCSSSEGQSSVSDNLQFLTRPRVELNNSITNGSPYMKKKGSLTLDEKSQLQSRSFHMPPLSLCVPSTSINRSLTIPKRACLVHHDKQFNLNHELLSQPIVNRYLVRPREESTWDSPRHYMAIPGQRYFFD